MSRPRRSYTSTPTSSGSASKRAAVASSCSCQGNLWRMQNVLVAVRAMAFRSNGGHIAGEDISAYVDEELSPAETSRVHTHLQSCDDCRALADDMRATQTLVRTMPLVRAPRDFTLGPEFDAAPGRQPSYDAPKRHWFNFMPAVALSAAVLLLLVFADLSSLSLGGAND